MPLDLSEFGSLTEEQSQTIMQALGKGANALYQGISVNKKIIDELTLFDDNVKTKLADALETFIRACDSKITELNQKLQPKD